MSGADHSDDLRVHGLREDAPARGDVVHNLVERSPLDLLALEVGHRIHEVEPDAALPQLSDEQLLLLMAGNIWDENEIRNLEVGCNRIWQILLINSPISPWVKSARYWLNKYCNFEGKEIFLFKF